MISSALSSFLEALGRLSLIGARVDADHVEAPVAAGFYPLVGLLIGLTAAFTLLGAGAFFPEPVPVALTLAAALALTGAVHEIGLMRAADHLAGDATRRTGTLVVVAVLGLKAAALMGMDAFSAARTLIAVHAASRFAMVLVMWALPSAANLGGSDGNGVTSNILAMALLFGFLPAALVLSPVTAALASVAGFAAAAIAAVICVRKGLGARKETIAAVQQAFETAFLIIAAGVISGPG